MTMFQILRDMFTYQAMHYIISFKRETSFAVIIKLSECQHFSVRRKDCHSPHYAAESQISISYCFLSTYHTPYVEEVSVTLDNFY